MKTETEVHTALAGLVLMMGKPPYRTPGQLKAMHCTDMLLWVMGYPNGFDYFFEQLQKSGLPMEDIDKSIRELVANYKPTEDPDTHTE